VCALAWQLVIKFKTRCTVVQVTSCTRASWNSLTTAIALGYIKQKTILIKSLKSFCLKFKLKKSEKDLLHVRLVTAATESSRDLLILSSPLASAEGKSAASILFSTPHTGQVISFLFKQRTLILLSSSAQAKQME